MKRIELSKLLRKQGTYNTQLSNCALGQVRFLPCLNKYICAQIFKILPLKSTFFSFIQRSLHSSLPTSGLLFIRQWLIFIISLYKSRTIQNIFCLYHYHTCNARTLRIQPWSLCSTIQSCNTIQLLQMSRDAIQNMCILTWKSMLFHSFFKTDT